MTETLALLPGWGLGPAAMEPLAAALRDTKLEAQVLTVALPVGDSAEQVLSALDGAIAPGAWLLGWSLGGMLATALATRRGTACPGLVTIASNPCFVACEQWPAAMTSATFNAFAEQCHSDPVGTLKRFTLLCAQGAANPRTLAKRLAAVEARQADPAGLALLASLDNRAALETLSVPQLHLFASADAMVPPPAAAALARLAPQSHIGVIEGSHALPMEAPGALAERIAAFIQGPLR